MKSEYIFLYVHPDYKNQYKIINYVSKLYKEYKFIMMNIPKKINEAQYECKHMLIDAGIDFDEISYNKSNVSRYSIDSDKLKLYKKIKGRSVNVSISNMIKKLNDELKIVLIFKSNDLEFNKSDLIIKSINKLIDKNEILVKVI